MSSILIVPVGAVAGCDLPALCPPIEQAFRISAAVRRGAPLDPQFAFDTFRNQYNSTDLLTEILKRYSAHPGKVIGVTSHDLFVPVLTYVFGEAQLEGQAAVVSAHRLHESFYGLNPEPALEHQRLVKEVVHELGHTFGLFHCFNMDCVMRSSTAVEEIDIKGREFCEECLEKMKGTQMADDR
jgi:archaemetzincin